MSDIVIASFLFGDVIISKFLSLKQTNGISSCYT
jgi:hypothetical protein